MAGANAAPRGVTLLTFAGFLCLLLLVTWVLIWSSSTLKVDRLLHDSWVRLSQREPPSDIVIAGIDPDSLAVIGRWPWERNTQALIFERLAEMDVKAVVVDLIYTEPSPNQEYDQQLLESIEKLPQVFLPVLTEGQTLEASSEKLPLPMLTRAATDLGHINLPIDSDGIVRRFHLKAGTPLPHWSAMALAAFEAIDPAAPDILDPLPGRQLNQTDGILTDWRADYEVLIPFYGPRDTFNTVSVVDIINGKVPAETLKDKIVFVGMMSTGLNDVVPSPVSALNQSIPGVEVHANVYAALRDGSLVTAINKHWNLLFAALLMPLMMLVYSRARAQWVLLLAAGGALIPIFASLGMYWFAKLWYPPLAASVPIFISYLLWSWNRLYFINRFLERETVKFGSREIVSDDTSNELLVNFFEAACKHLPIKGWRFSAKGEEFNGGMTLPRREDIDTGNRWELVDGVYRKRYPTPGRLEISLVVNSPYVAKEITDYIDTLARVRARIEPAKLSGSIERLEINAFKLGDQMERLRGVANFSETIMAGISAGFMVWNAAGEQINTNKRIYRWFPTLPPRAQLRDFLNVVWEGSNEAVDDERMARLVLHGEPWQLTVNLAEQEYVVGFDSFGDNLKDRMICASVIDVSDIRSAERARSELVEYLSHDLRSPLISSLYLLEDVEPNNEDEEASRDAAERIQVNIKRSLKMMDDLLQVSKADTLSADTFEELLFNDVVDNALDQLVPQARSRGITLQLESNEHEMEYWMDGDAGLLERAVINVVGNAIKYSQDGGLVSVSMNLPDESTIVELSVQDDGVGIDPNIIDDIFTRFKRDARVADQFKGIGLGLALVARVVEQHGGTVKAYSDGKGTRVSMKLPVKFAEAGLGEQAALS